MKNIFEYVLFLSFSFSFRLIGLKLARNASAIIAFIFFYLIPIRKNVVLKNLKIAFPHFNNKEILNIAFKSYLSFSKTLVEILLLPSLSQSKISEIVTIKNLESLIDSYNKGKGLILISAHFGNWELAAISTGIKMNYSLNVVIKYLRNPYVSKWMNNNRTKFGNKIIPLGVSIRQVYAALKKGEIIAVVADQRGPEQGMRVKFFERDTAVYNGPAALAVKSGAPMYCGFMIRQQDGNYIMDFELVDTTSVSNNEDENIQFITRRYLEKLESAIKNHPEQWLWMHNIWKY